MKMFVINDKDLPITVAEKIIKGTKPTNSSEKMKELAKRLTGDPNAGETEEMFTLEEIKEIADYLNVYYLNHIDGD